MTLLVVYLSVAIGVSFMCSVLEAVLLSVTPSFVESLQRSRPHSAKRLVQVKENIGESLAAILILNTFAHTMGAAGVGSQAILIFGSQWETLIAVLLTLVILYVSEIIPKTLGATYWPRLAHLAALIISILVKLVYPLIWIANLLNKGFHGKEESGITREEVLALASLSHKSGSLFQQETDYLANLLRLPEKRTEQILTPRSVVHMLNEATSVTDALNDLETRRFTRIPTFREDTDHVIGLVIRADLFEAERQGKGDWPIRDLAQPVFRVSEKLPVHKLLDVFIKNKSHLFLVEDEFGQTAGVVTLEDAIETLLGREITDERDLVEDMQALAKAKYRARLRGH